MLWVITLVDVPRSEAFVCVLFLIPCYFFVGAVDVVVGGGVW